MQLVAELTRLGATVIAADASSLILGTGKHDVPGAVGCGPPQCFEGFFDFTVLPGIDFFVASLVSMFWYRQGALSGHSLSVAGSVGECRSEGPCCSCGAVLQGPTTSMELWFEVADYLHGHQAVGSCPNCSGQLPPCRHTLGRLSGHARSATQLAITRHTSLLGSKQRPPASFQSSGTGR